ncbi:hypothetical protein LIER_27646 [Lithospermum erythrorhizon]|uniref:Uncharacterized protein n=1 Tax=Lithospermum erythrorhizon TaxID=34254 RepID=A0AAV3REH0_LITER
MITSVRGGNWYDAEQVTSQATSADLTTPHPAARQGKERLSQTIPRRTISTFLTKIVESPLGVPSPTVDRPIDNPSSMDEEDNQTQNHLPNNAHRPPCLAERRVNEALEWERGKTIQSSLYTHHSGGGATSESNEAQSSHDHKERRHAGPQYP